MSLFPGGVMQDYRLRIGMRFIRQSREFIIESPLPDGQIKVKDTITGQYNNESYNDLVDSLFDGKIELIGENREHKTLLEIFSNTKVDDLTLLKDSDPLRIEAIRRHHYVYEVFNRNLPTKTDKTLTPIIEIIAAQIKDSAPPSCRTLKRWCQIYDRAGRDIRALVPATKSQGNRQKKYSGHKIKSFSEEENLKAKEVEQIIDKIIRIKYLSPERPTVVSVHSSVEVEIYSINKFRNEIDKLPVPHKSSIYRAIKQLDQYEVDLARQGKKFADAKFRQKGKGPRPSRILERVESDNTKLDLFVVDHKARLPLGRPWITTMMDVYSKVITGMYVSFNPPCFLNIQRCLIHAIQRKPYLKTLYPDIEHDWPTHGIPELLYVDNGRDFVSKDLELACLQLGTRIEYAPVRKAWYKGTMERWFKTQNQKLLHELPGTTFSNIFDKGDYDSQKNAVISIVGLMELIHLWIVDIYHQFPHRGINDIPYQRWEKSIKEWPPNLAPISGNLKVLLGRAKERTISASGIDFLTLRYNCAELAYLRRNTEKNKKFIIRYDPGDISVIYVRDPYSNNDPFSDNDIVVPALNQDYTKGLSEWQHEVIKRYARRSLIDRTDNEGLCRAKEKVQKIVEREIFETNSAGKIRRKQTAARYLKMGQELIIENPVKIEEPKLLPPANSNLSLSTKTTLTKRKKTKSKASKDLNEPSLSIQEGWSVDYSLPLRNGRKVTK